jgi:flagellar biosynthesis anti-sigma factor FlgM
LPDPDGACLVKACSALKAKVIARYADKKEISLAGGGMGIYSKKPPEGRNLYIKTRRAGKYDPVQAKGLSGEEVVGMINFSTRARLIIELKSAIARLPEIRDGKVLAIQKALNEGTYEIDSRKIAEGLIDEAT